MPPMPTIGSDVAARQVATTAESATGLTAGPLRPPPGPPSTGRPVVRSTAIPRTVLMQHERVGAALLGSAGDRGDVGHVRRELDPQRQTRRRHGSGRRRRASRRRRSRSRCSPISTFGQETFSSSAADAVLAVERARQSRAYSSCAKPPIETTSGRPSAASRGSTSRLERVDARVREPDGVEHAGRRLGDPRRRVALARQRRHGLGGDRGQRPGGSETPAAGAPRAGRACPRRSAPDAPAAARRPRWRAAHAAALASRPGGARPRPGPRRTAAAGARRAGPRSRSRRRSRRPSAPRARPGRARRARRRARRPRAASDRARRRAPRSRRAGPPRAAASPARARARPRAARAARGRRPPRARRRGSRPRGGPPRAARRATASRRCRCRRSRARARRPAAASSNPRPNGPCTSTSTPTSQSAARPGPRTSSRNSHLVRRARRIADSGRPRKASPSTRPQHVEATRRAGVERALEPDQPVAPDALGAEDAAPHRVQLLQALRLDHPGPSDGLHGRGCARDRRQARHLGRDRGGADQVAVARAPRGPRAC